MKATKAIAAATVDEYINAFPENKRNALEKLRRQIKSVAPDTEEVISYQIPTFRYKGRGLVAYAAFTEHCSLFPMSKALMKEFSEELKPYSTATSTIHFNADKPLPALLVKKIVKSLMKATDEKLAFKKKK